jgi:hypothetical protein
MCACLREREFGNYKGDYQIIPKIRELLRENNKTMQDFEYCSLERKYLKNANFQTGQVSLKSFLLCNGFLTIVDYNKGSDTVYLSYPNREIRNQLDNELSKELIGEDDEGKSRLMNALEQNDMERLVYLLNEHNFRDDLLSQSLRRDTAEFTRTKTILKSLKSAHVDCEEGIVLYAMNGTDEGDLDFVAKTTSSKYVVEVKYNHDAVKALLQLICYIIESESAFLEAINSEKIIFLVGMNLQSSKTTTGQTTVTINQWARLPYRNYTIRIDEFRTSSNLEEKFIPDLKNRLKQKSIQGSIDYVNSDKIIW